VSPYLSEFTRRLWHALRSLAPIVAVVLVFQVLVFQQVPDQPVQIVLGLGVVAVGIAVFLQGLDLSVFPAGKSLANQFARRGSLLPLLAFGFAIGFAAVVAEPALIAIAEQAEEVSQGRVDGIALRLVVAVSVGAVIAVGIMRILRGWNIRLLLIGGYVVVLAVTYVAPPEIVGLAYDSGGVTTNIVTVPLIAAIGLGLAGSIRGRSPLIDGFGLVALAVMVPMISVQVYGIWVYSFGEPAEVAAAGSQDDAPHWALELVLGLATMVRDVLPLVLVVLVFQYLVLRRGLANPVRVGVGFVMVLLGLYAFVLGLKWGLLPLGTVMADQLIERDAAVLIVLFAFLIGFATTMAEPALVAIGEQAEAAAPGRLRGSTIRLVVALGVAVGIAVGVLRIVVGGPLHTYIIIGYAVVVVLTLVAPAAITALAFDLGGVTTSEVTVPLITALGIGLAGAIDGRDLLIDGFGLIAFASLFAVIAVLLYAIGREVLDSRQRTNLPTPYREEAV
jgi:hypothetical protein